MRALILTWHDESSPARASTHFLAEALLRRGWTVTWTMARWGPRAAASAQGGRVRETTRAGLRATTIWRARRRRQGMLARLWLRASRAYRGGLSAHVAAEARRADLVIVEPDEPLVHVPAIAALATRARLVYRVTDALPAGRADIAAAEAAALPTFHHLVFPSGRIAALYKGRTQAPGTVIPHALDTDLFDRQHPNPYPPGTTNAIFTGMHAFDWATVATAATVRPDITFHVIGPWENDAPALPNVRTYGVRPFVETVPFVQHASLALHPVPPDRTDRRVLAATLKLQQYAYCRLPVLSPDYVALEAANAFAYAHGDPASIASALGCALAFDRRAFDPGPIRSWDAFAEELLRSAGLPEPP